MNVYKIWFSDRENILKQRLNVLLHEFFSGLQKK